MSYIKKYLTKYGHYMATNHNSDIYRRYTKYEPSPKEYLKLRNRRLIKKY